MSFWKSGKDTLQNGAILGAVAGLLMFYGDKVVNFVTGWIPSKYMYFGDLSLLIYSVGIFSLVGYLLDRY